MAENDPTYEETWRGFYNFMFQTMPNIKLLLAPLEKARDVEKFLSESAEIFERKQFEIKELDDQLAKRQSALDSLDADLKQAEQKYTLQVTTMQATLSDLQKQANIASDGVKRTKAAAATEINDISNQIEQYKATRDQLLFETESARNALAALRERIANAAALLST